MKIENTVYIVTLLLLFSCGNQKKEETVGKEQETKPNIIFIFADDWGYGDLGCYGNTQVATPNIDKLAMQGTKYTQFHVTSGVCSPSRTSVITGHFPVAHKVHGHFAGNEKNQSRGMPNNWLNENLKVYLPRIMQKAGYATAHFGKWHLGGGGEPNGDLSAPEPKEYGYDETRVWNGNGPSWKGDVHWPTTRYMDSDTLWVQSSSRIVVDETINFLKRKSKEDPIFINLWLKDPHTPLWPNEEQRKPYKGLEPDKETYFSVLTDADYHIGRLMDALETMGLEENSLVIFTSDNGPAGYGPAKIAGSTAGLKGEKATLFQGGVNVPFIVRWPGHVDKGKTDTTSVISAVDLLPTFVDLAKTQLPKDYRPDGESFASIFKNESFQRRKPLYWDWRFSSNTEHNPHNWVSGAIRLGDWKLLVSSNNERMELYNLIDDRFERNDLSKTNISKTCELLAMLSTWQNNHVETEAE
ncbi:hypothetical protein BFP77_04600 [Maribacter sp. 4U21]|uniref:sulfatase-like hydrolase/transferase n=1 Tax=Maribacter sp. 4U21 TaxID=1889779 RepID=UPI000C14D2F3|nr:sulfatase-like hydrolase/transferase [Maribacter sp. 4U21]PIB30418.1 hypothetical protein BFP77_04600 [Maribacter sp. 4U21]